MTPQPMAGHRGRYLMIGCVCAVANNLIMIGGDRAGFHYTLAILFSVITVAPAAYVLHAHFTFSARFSLRSLLLYMMGTIVALPLSLGIMAVLCSIGGMPVPIAAPITTVLLFIWNYASANWSIARRLLWVR